MHTAAQKGTSARQVISAPIQANGRAGWGPEASGKRHQPRPATAQKNKTAKKHRASGGP